MQAGHDGAERDVEDLRRVRVAEVADVDEHDDVTEVVGERGERGHDRVLGEPLDDAVISAAVKTKLARDRTATLTGIEVETVNRTVYLRGTAPDGAAKQRAASLARRVDGVVAVENELEVTKTTRAGDAPQ